MLIKGKSSGRKKKLSPLIEASLRQELIDEQGFSSYKEIQIWLRVVHDVEMSYTGVHQLVRYRLKAKLKVPCPVHIKQEEGIVEDFKKAHRHATHSRCQSCQARQWGAGRMPRSSSSTTSQLRCVRPV